MTYPQNDPLAFLGNPPEMKSADTVFARLVELTRSPNDTVAVRACELYLLARGLADGGLRATKTTEEIEEELRK